MFKKVNVHAHFNDRTGYGIHATNFFGELEKLIPLQKQLPYDGDVSISLLDSVSAQHVNDRHPFPSILYNVWESTLQPEGFMRQLGKYDQMWCPSEWQRQCTIDQGVNPEFVKVVPEGIDPEIYRPIGSDIHLHDCPITFLIVGKWEHRKSTREMIATWLEVFKDTPDVRLQISVDNPFPVDEYTTTEERLAGYELEDPRIEIIHFEEKNNYISRLRRAHVFLSCSRAEGWNLPLIESMACGIPSVALDWSGSTEYAKDAILVKVKELKPPEHVYGMPNCPGLWAEPDWDDFKKVIKDAYENWEFHRKNALKTAEYIRDEFSWRRAALKAMAVLNGIETSKAQIIETTPKDQIVCIGCWPNSEEKMTTLVETINQIKTAGYPVLITSHYPLIPAIVEMADYYIYDKKNILSGDWRATYFRFKDGVKEEAKASIPYHAVAVLNAIENAIDFCVGKYSVMHYMEYDIEFDLKEYIALWNNRQEDKMMLALTYEGQKDQIQSCLFSGNLEWLNETFPRVTSWEEYLEKYGEDNYVLENWLMKYYGSMPWISDDIEIVDYPVTNRYDQVDREVWADDLFAINFLNGPQLTINGLSRREYDVSFSNPQDGEQYKTIQKVGTWSSPATKFYREWTVKASLNGELKFEHKLNLEGKKVIIAMGSKALGDTMAWIPYFDEFRKKHKCHVIASTWFNDLFDYPELEWTTPGATHKDVYAVYEVGCFDGDIYKNPRDWRTVRMQEIATDILGLEYHEIKPKMKKVEPNTFSKPHVTFSEHSTMKSKLWNRDGGWQQVIDYLNNAGYEVVSISSEPTTLKNVTPRNKQSIEETVKTMAGAKFHIGLGAGPSWLAWGVGIPVVMISGFSEPWCEFNNLWRVFPSNGSCHGCFNDPTVKFDRGWEFCPQNKDYECTKNITPEYVIERIEDLITRP